MGKSKNKKNEGVLQLLNNTAGDIRSLIQEAITADEQKIDRITSCFTKLPIIKRNTIILTQGQVCKHFYFIETGCVRSYYITKEGLEKTRLIMFEHSPLTVLSSIISQKPTIEYLETLEDTVLYSISQEDFFLLRKEIPEWDEFYQRMLVDAFLFQNSKIEELVTLSAKERYKKLLKEKPHYIQRVTNKVLATYLDISQETLSRLKSK
ncbi:MAG TPA: Crp/Fnr family transcriptional regulator [Paludibacter sp.]|nr:Crp/Fnr family transcriptional regulator [Paludibacter sp.]